LDVDRLRALRLRDEDGGHGDVVRRDRQHRYVGGRWGGRLRRFAAASRERCGADDDGSRRANAFPAGHERTSPVERCWRTFLQHPCRVVDSRTGALASVTWGARAALCGGVAWGAPAALCGGVAWGATPREFGRLRPVPSAAGAPQATPPHSTRSVLGGDCGGFDAEELVVRG